MKPKTNFIPFLLIFFISLVSWSAYAQSEETSKWKVGVSGAGAVLESDFGYGGTLEILNNPFENLPLYVGLETGFLYWSDSAFGVADLSMKAFPILPSVSYRFNKGTNITPYIGLGLGFTYARMSASGTFAGIGISASGSTTEFTMLFKPGVEISKFFFEPKFGFLKDSFLFVGSVGYRF